MEELKKIGWGLFIAFLVISFFYVMTNGKKKTKTPSYSYGNNTVQQYQPPKPELESPSLNNNLNTEKYDNIILPPVQNNAPVVSTRSATPDDAYDEGYDDGYEQGLEDGKNGNNNGYGYDDSNEYYDYYDTKYKEGYEEGYEEGYREGERKYEIEIEEEEEEEEEEEDYYDDGL